MLNIPLQAVANQTLSTQVTSQNVVINLYNKTEYGLFCDVVSNGTTIITGVIARNAVPLIPDDYMGFVGNFIFIDTQGSNDPDYSLFGSRYYLLYLTAAEYALISE